MGGDEIQDAGIGNKPSEIGAMMDDSKCLISIMILERSS